MVRLLFSFYASSSLNKIKSLLQQEYNNIGEEYKQSSKQQLHFENKILQDTYNEINQIQKNEEIEDNTYSHTPDINMFIKKDYSKFAKNHPVKYGLKINSTAI